MHTTSYMSPKGWMKATITKSSNEMGTTMYILQRLLVTEHLSFPSSHRKETVFPGIEGNEEDRIREAL